MKLVVAIPFFYPQRGGTENYALQICKRLVNKHKYEITVITSTDQKKAYTKEVAGMTTHYLPYWLKISNTPINPLWFWKIWQIVSQEKPDRIIGHTPVPFIADVAAVIAYLQRIPFYLTYQNDMIKDQALLNLIIAVYYELVGRITFSISRKIIVSSAYYAKQSPYLRTTKTSTAVIPPGVDVSKFKPASVTKKNMQFNVLFVGNMDLTHSHKGLSVLLEAVAQAKETISSIRLTAIGKGDGIKAYKLQAKELGILEKVCFTGYVPDEDLPRYFQETDVLVLPSVTSAEGFGMVLIEAGACGKPVIGARSGGIRHVVLDGKTGILVPPKQPKSLKEALVYLNQNPQKAEKMGRNGLAHVLANYTWEEQVAKTHDTLRN
ncbi:MAG: glycosyltransferase family 4 protein [Patescibacteria group bacterium]